MSDASRPKQLALPDLGDFLFLFVIWSTLFALRDRLYSDGSTGWHLVSGDYVLKSGSVAHVDLISNTFADKAWVSYEWLFDLVIALITNKGGLSLLAVVISVALGYLFLSIYERARREGSGAIVAVAIVMLAILISLSHTLARPHLVTFWAVWIFSTDLEDFVRDRISMRRLSITLTLIMLVWVNCHPAFALGILIAGIHAASQVVLWSFGRLPEERRRHRAKAQLLLALCVGLGLITIVNPYGLELHRYIFQYWSEGVHTHTSEFMSPVFKGNMHSTCLELMFFVLAAGLALARTQISAGGFLTCLVLAHFALAAVRSMPIFAIVAAPYLAGLFPASGTTAKVAGTVFGAAAAVYSRFNDLEGRCKRHLIPLACSILLLMFSCFFQPIYEKNMTSKFDPVRLPTGTLTYIKNNNLDLKHGLNYDNWGGYLRYSLGKRVFIDDRADFYGPAFYSDYARVMTAAEGWQSVLDKYQIDWILFPAQSRLTETLANDPRWSLTASDAASQLYLRSTVKIRRRD